MLEIIIRNTWRYIIHKYMERY